MELLSSFTASSLSVFSWLFSAALFLLAFFSFFLPAPSLSPLKGVLHHWNVVVIGALVNVHCVRLIFVFVVLCAILALLFLLKNVDWLDVRDVIIADRIHRVTVLQSSTACLRIGCPLGSSKHLDETGTSCILTWITSSGVGGFVPPRCCCTAGLPGSSASAARAGMVAGASCTVAMPSAMETIPWTAIGSMMLAGD